MLSEFFVKTRGAPVTPVIQNVEKAASANGYTSSKNGHRLSFVGLFLFSLVLYIRPYELFPALKWLNNIAFLLAMATLVVYVPTQLGLTGKLTIRPREVNLILLLLALALLSVPLALNPLLAWNGFVDYLKMVIMFIVLVNVVRTEGRLKLLFMLVLVVSCALSIAALSDYRPFGWSSAAAIRDCSRTVLITQMTCSSLVTMIHSHLSAFWFEGTFQEVVLCGERYSHDRGSGGDVLKRWFAGAGVYGKRSRLANWS